MGPPSGASVNSKEANVNKTAYDFVPILQAIEFLKASALTKSEQDKILAEMAISIPHPLFCRTCPDTLAIIEQKLGVTHGETTQSTEEISKDGTDTPSTGAEGQGQLLLQADADRGGKGPTKAVVNKKASKRGSSIRNT